MSLERARERRDAARQDVANGLDPTLRRTSVLTRALGWRELYSEDMADGREVEGILIINPFR